VLTRFQILSALAALLAANLSFSPSSYSFHESETTPPLPPREFRGAWVATVANIDWPSKPGLSATEQQIEMLAILDTAQRLHLNAIVLQVRPACDALYDSKLEPWSEYLTGHMGDAPAPYYDPLQFAIDEAHRRGIELHAWFNPYRAHQAESHAEFCENHVSLKHPELVRAYGKSLWLDPSEKAVQDYSIRVILDVVKRYDIDGVHLDDYFYPYKENGPDGKPMDFPDETNWQKYQKEGGALNRDDWRRDQVDRFIERLYKAIKHEKNWVKFGISPFGIWRPGNPPSIRGFDAYQQIYADSKLWLNQGWLDYWSPQLYWKQGQAGQSYSELLHWWTSENTKHRNIWPGNYTSRVADGSATSWDAAEIIKQINVTRHEPGAGGNLHFSMKALMQPRTGLADALSRTAYAEPALVPASPWLRRERIGKPKISLKRDTQDSAVYIDWKPTGKGKAWLWLVQIKRRSSWQNIVQPAEQASHKLEDWVAGQHSTTIAITPVDRCGNLGPHAVIAINDSTAPPAPAGLTIDRRPKPQRTDGLH
jgi:uncharacterized lipoprotein YddW (UPF0748 family)